MHSSFIHYAYIIHPHNHPMGKLVFDPSTAHSQRCKDHDCKDQDAPICGNVSCRGSSYDSVYYDEKTKRVWSSKQIIASNNTK